MTQFDYLQVFDLILTVRTPLCVGSGFSYQKNEYLFHPGTKRVSILNRDAFLELLLRKDLVDAYERFILEGGKLYPFLRYNCRLTEEEIESVIRYSVSAADALTEHQPLREIQAFRRDAAGRPYVPGSSVKGALRTAYLIHCILEDKQPRMTAFHEEQYLHVLTSYGRYQNSILNDILRGVQISDSMPLDDEKMILAGKQDFSVDGRSKKINVCRECIKPGEKIRMKLTLDQYILGQRITKETLLQSIAQFSEYYQEIYCKHFRLPAQASTKLDPNCLFLGAGTGFFTKTVTYPYYGERRALEQTAAWMQKKFSAGRHERDRIVGISPHTLKYTSYGGKLYPVGVCEVEIL